MGVDIHFSPANVIVSFKKDQAGRHFLRGFLEAQRNNLSGLQSDEGAAFHNSYHRGVSFWYRLIKYCQLHNIEYHQEVIRLFDDEKENDTALEVDMGCKGGKKGSGTKGTGSKGTKKGTKN